MSGKINKKKKIFVMDKNDEIPSFIRNIISIIVGAFVVVCVCNIACMFIPLFKNDSDFFSSVQLAQISIFLAFLTITLAITVMVPYFFSKKKLESTIIKFLEKDYKTTLLLRAEDVTRTDAHLSRMIAFFLLENGHYHWAIGWSFRSLKRYSGIDGAYQKVYKEFHGMIFNEIILKALERIANRGFDKKDESTEKRFDNKDEEFLIRIRAVKDFLDFEYEIENGKKDPDFVKEMRKTYGDSLAKIETGMLCVYANLYLSEFVKTDGKTDIKLLKEKIDEKIRSGSKYKDDKEFSPFYDSMNAKCFSISEKSLEDCGFKKYYDDVIKQINSDEILKNCVDSIISKKISQKEQK